MGHLGHAVGTAVTKESPTVSVPRSTRTRVRTVADGVPETTADTSPPAKTTRTLVKSRPMEDDSDGFLTPDDTPIIENISPRSRSKGRLHAKRKATSPTNVVPKVARCISERNLRASPVRHVTPPRSVVDTPPFLLPSSSTSPEAGTSYEPERDPQCNAVFTLKMTPTKLAKMITVPRIRNLDITRFEKPKNDQFAPPRDDPYWDFLHRSPYKQQHPTGSVPANPASVPTSNTASEAPACSSVAEPGPKRNPARALKGRRIIPESPSPAKVPKKHVHPKPIALKPIPEAKPADPHVAAPSKSSKSKQPAAPKAVSAPTKSSNTKQPVPSKSVAAPAKPSKTKQPAQLKATASTSKKPNSQPAPSTQPADKPPPKKPAKKKAAAKRATTPATVSSKTQKATSKQQVSSVPRRNDNQLTASQRRFRKRYRNQERQYFDAFKLCRTDPATSSVRPNVADFPVSFLKRPVRVATKRPRQNRSTQLAQTDDSFTLHASESNKKAIEEREKLFKERSVHKPEVLTQYFHGLTKTKLSEVEEIGGTDYLLSSNDTEKLKWKSTLQITERDADRLQSANGMSFGRPPVKVDNTKDDTVLRANGVPLPLWTAKECAIPTNRIGFTSEECQIELQKSKKASKEQEPVKTLPKKSSKSKKPTASKPQNNPQLSCRVQPANFVKGPESQQQTVLESVESKTFDDLLYHADASDFAWLERDGRSIKYAEFQQIVQILEIDSYMKRCLFKVRDLELQWDRTDNKNYTGIEGDPCSICLTEDIDDDSVLVFCDGCNVAVHTSCYGISVVPEGSWLCDSCRDEHAFPQCYFCPVPNGAVHLTEDELHFVHTTCAIWHPFATYMDLPKRKRLIARKYLYNAARYVPCYVCGIQYGVVAFCSMDGCGKPFHIGCADRCGFWMVEDMRNPAKTEYSVYCYEHSKVKANAYFASHKRRDELIKIRDRDGRRDLLFEPSLVMFDELEKDFLAFAPRVNDDLFKKFDVGQVAEVFDYWKAKRLNRGRPLIDPCKIPASAFPRFSKEAKNPVDMPVTTIKPPLELDELKQWHAVQKYLARAEKSDVDAVSSGVATLGLLEKGRGRSQSKAARGNYMKLLKSTKAAANDSDDGARPKRRRTSGDPPAQTQEGDDDCVVFAENESTVVLGDDHQDDESAPSASTVKRRSPKRPRVKSADTSAKQLFDDMVTTLGLNETTENNNQHFVLSTLSEADRIGFSFVPKDPTIVADAEANDDVPDVDDEVIVEDPEPPVPISHQHHTRINRRHNGEPVEKEPRLDDDSLPSPEVDQDPTREVDVEEVLESFINFVDPITSVWAKW